MGMLAPAQRPDNRPKTSLRRNAASARRCLMSRPFRADESETCNPGRCPGLVCMTPLGSGILIRVHSRSSRTYFSFQDERPLCHPEAESRPTGGNGLRRPPLRQDTVNASRAHPWRPGPAAMQPSWGGFQTRPYGGPFMRRGGQDSPWPLPWPHSAAAGRSHRARSQGPSSTRTRWTLPSSTSVMPCPWAWRAPSRSIPMTPCSMAAGFSTVIS